ncbi:DUF2797 domain-containing protein [Balneatrix alpica]|uniref:DUF2797 domain-containing protein n=1 Tax=Balneatrix alpica TaxID=75684 RepID=A0ABV5Z715_9GAMM|nr:DUF2797 domain-containing protein [Balneatrix alpica]
MWQLIGQGALEKMEASQADQVQYQLDLGQGAIALNLLLGKRVRLRYCGSIHCVHCGRLTKKSFNQGYCYPCFTQLAACDPCMLDPVRCHYEQGTCREPEWGEQVCMQDHFVYLADTSAAKVGITRSSQVPRRWLDQGATSGLLLMRTRTRQQAGFVEDLLRSQLSDRTAWQRMLKGQSEAVDLLALREQLLQDFAEPLTDLTQRFGIQAIQPLLEQQPQHFVYPVLQYPSKVKAHNLDKDAEVSGQLLGIKGQYWILDTGVINIRKYTAYQVELAIEH